MFRHRRPSVPIVRNWPNHTGKLSPFPSLLVRKAPVPRGSHSRRGIPLRRKRKHGPAGSLLHLKPRLPSHMHGSRLLKRRRGRSTSTGRPQNPLITNPLARKLRMRAIPLPRPQARIHNPGAGHPRSRALRHRSRLHTEPTPGLLPLVRDCPPGLSRSSSRSHSLRWARWSISASSDSAEPILRKKPGCRNPELRPPRKSPTRFRSMSKSSVFECSAKNRSRWCGLSS